MPSTRADAEAAEHPVPDPPRARNVARRSFLKGLAILLPLVITLLVFSLMFSFISNAIDPLVVALGTTPLLEGESGGLVRLLMIALFFMLVFSIGFVSEYGSERNHVAEQFDVFMASLPGIGSMYSGFNEMSELLLDSDTDSASTDGGKSTHD